ncbi:MAG TPA: hypothetical protein VFQ26_06165 [Nitrospiraceae bacterium]|nr:hypothetical protein [Nitrospiraceae bacterium]
MDAAALTVITTVGFAAHTIELNDTRFGKVYPVTLYAPSFGFPVDFVRCGGDVKCEQESYIRSIMCKYRPIEEIVAHLSPCIERSYASSLSPVDDLFECIDRSVSSTMLVDCNVLRGLFIQKVISKGYEIHCNLLPVTDPSNLVFTRDCVLGVSSQAVLASNLDVNMYLVLAVIVGGLLCCGQLSVMALQCSNQRAKTLAELYIPKGRRGLGSVGRGTYTNLKRADEVDSSDDSNYEETYGDEKEEEDVEHVYSNAPRSDDHYMPSPGTVSLDIGEDAASSS